MIMAVKETRKKLLKGIIKKKCCAKNCKQMQNDAVSSFPSLKGKKEFDGADYDKKLNQ
jgi:hypothetical protein